MSEQATPRTQTLNDVRTALESAGLRPQRSLGQNFLIDGNLLRKLVEAAEIGRGETVIEVGGGTGALTDLLAHRAAKVLVVELDRGLCAILKERFSIIEKVTIHHGDALAGKHRLCTFLEYELEQLELESNGHDGHSCVSLIANLPYGIASPLLVNLLMGPGSVTKLCFTVQSEVADRIVAKPRTKDYGPLSIILQAACKVSLIARVPPTAFWPRPKVESTMLRLDRIQPAIFDRAALAAFASFVRSAFLHRRKTLGYNLRSGLSQEALPALKTSVNLRARPEELSVPQWIDLFRHWLQDKNKSQLPTVAARPEQAG